VTRIARNQLHISLQQHTLGTEALKDLIFQTLRRKIIQFLPQMRDELAIIRETIVTELDLLGPVPNSD